MFDVEECRARDWLDRRREGPSAGVFPFWLSAWMLVCCVWIIVGWVRRETTVSRSTEPFIKREVAKVVFTVVAALVAVTHWAGVYIAISLFLAFYLRVLGKHTWLKTGLTAVIAPVVMFRYFLSGRSLDQSCSSLLRCLRGQWQDLLLTACVARKRE